ESTQPCEPGEGDGATRSQRKALSRIRSCRRNPTPAGGGSLVGVWMPKLIVDSIHGDIRLSDEERRVIDTASFQRLRNLKQLGMGQVTYPGATHTRFAHSIGVLGIMARVTREAKESLGLTDDQVSDIRLAGLLHDVGHYPYSHLMEVIDNVVLTEDFVSDGKK